MNEQILAALAAQDPSLKPLLAAMNGGGDVSALLPLLITAVVRTIVCWKVFLKLSC